MRLTLTPLSEADAAALIAANGAPTDEKAWLLRWWTDKEGLAYVLDAGTIYRVTVEETQT